VPVELHLLREQPHNYALMPTPEGDARVRSFCERWLKGKV
jgi:hypothetical protein